MSRHQDRPFPVQDGSFITNLFCYDRHEGALSAHVDWVRV